MKKTRFITIVLLIAVMLMGAGYAYWQEELKINTTVTTGELDLQFAPLGWLDGPNSGDYDNKRPYNDDYMNVTLTAKDNNHKLECTFEDIYPGAGGYIQFRIDNKGTVPAKLTSITTANVSDPAGLKDEFNYVIHSLKIYVPGIGEIMGIPVDSPMYADTFEDFIGKLEDKLSQYTLQPEGYVIINGEGTGYDVQMPSTVTADSFENQTFTFDLLLNFQQGE